MFIYNNEKDPLERGIINLSMAQIVYNEEQIEMLQVRVISALTFDFVCLILLHFFIKNQNTFSVTTNNRGFLMQTLTGKEIFEWLYALNPLLAGELRSKLARGRENKPKNASSLSNTNSTSTPTKP